MQGWVFGKWNFSEQRWSGAIFYRAQCRDRRRFPRIWFLNCKKSSWHLTPLSFLSWFGLFVYSKKRKASDPASQPKASQIQKVSILKHSHDTSLGVIATYMYFLFVTNCHVRVRSARLSLLKAHCLLLSFPVWKRRNLSSSTGSS